jgi:hypothetical protein
VREKGVRTVVNKATAKLDDLSHKPEYKALLVRLILQVSYRGLRESELSYYLSLLN